MGCLFSKRFSRREGRRESRPQTFNLTGLGGENTEANTVYATGIHNETIINPDRRATLKHKLRTLDNKTQIYQRQLNERDSQIKKLENDIKQKQDKAILKDTENIQDQLDQLHKKVNMHRSEIARLENEVLPDLMAQRVEVKEQLGKHARNAQGKMEEVSVLNEKMQKLADKLEAYGRDVARERTKVEDLCSEIGKLEEDFKKIKSDQKTQMTAVQEMATEMETIKAAQAKQTEETENLRDEMREQRKLNQQMEKQHDEKLRKVQDQPKEEKMAREAAERKIQELEKRDAGHMETSQVSGDFKTGVYQQTGDEAKQHGASSDVEEMGTTATVREADDSVPHHGVTQKDSNPGHVDDLLGACRVGNMAKVKRILDLGQVDINCRGEWSRTPVMVAAEWGQRDMLELLLSRGADVSLVDENGNNILHLACHRGDVGTVKLILSRDVVDVNARNNSGKTAADKARGWAHHRVADLLVSRAAR